MATMELLRIEKGGNRSDNTANSPAMTPETQIFRMIDGLYLDMSWSCILTVPQFGLTNFAFTCNGYPEVRRSRMHCTHSLTP